MSHVNGFQEEVFAFYMKFKEWIKNIKPEKKIRNYQHIDSPLDLNLDKKFRKVVHVIKDVKNHQFLPFIKRSESVVRFRKNKEGKVQRLNKVRPIMYASHIDSHIYSYYNFLLSEEYEQYLKKLDISENITAYRKVQIEETEKGKSNVHFAKEVFDYIGEQDECVVVTQDIEGFFDNINHKILKEKICKVKCVDVLEPSFFKVFNSLTKYKYIEYKDFDNKLVRKEIRKQRYSKYKALKNILKSNKTNKGIPQGSPISGLLANISLLDFDNCVKVNFPQVFYRRYSDDLIFVCSREEIDSLLLFINKKIKELSLKISAKKSFISFFKKIENKLICELVTNGLHKPLGRNYVDYLGLEFDGNKIFLRKNTIQKLKHKQILKTKKSVFNSLKQVRRKPKKIRKTTVKGRSNYLKKAAEIVRNSGIDKQVLKVTKDRNNIRKSIAKKSSIL